MQEENTKTIQDMYAAFGRGDIQTLLAVMSEDIVWKPVLGAASYVPTAGERRGKAAVADFFKTLAQSIDFQEFQPKQFVAQDDTVVALGSYAATAKATGRPFKSEWTMVFTFKNGKVVEFKEYADSAAINASFQGAATRV
jgi:uncharacterized protein